MDRLLNNATRVAMGIGAGFFAVQQSLFTVYPGHRAVIFDRLQGVKQEVVGEGTHFLIPWVQVKVKYIFWTMQSFSLSVYTKNVVLLKSLAFFVVVLFYASTICRPTRKFQYVENIIQTPCALKLLYFSSRRPPKFTTFD
jgi:regulator of protease activity HflC (stomatin/prohibitin superfamily)